MHAAQTQMDDTVYHYELHCLWRLLSTKKNAPQIQARILYDSLNIQTGNATGIYSPTLYYTGNTIMTILVRFISIPKFPSTVFYKDLP